MGNLIATRDAYGQALLDFKHAIVMDADLSKATKTDIFAEKYPERFYNVGICEQGMFGIASGLATKEMPVVISSFAVFSALRANEIIRNSICYQKKNVKIVATHAGLSVGFDGGSHQSVEDIGVLKSIPNLTIISPIDPDETTKVMDTIMNNYDPTYVRLGRTPLPNVINYDTFEVGKVYPLNNVSSKKAVLGHGLVLNYVAQRCLEDVKIINCPTIKPLNVDSLLKELEGVNEIIVCEEHSIYGGLYETVARLLCNTDIKVIPLAIDDKFGESGAPDDVLRKHGLDIDSVEVFVKEFIK